MDGGLIAMKEFEIKLNDCDPWPEERCTKIPFLCPKCKEPDVWFEESGFWCQNCGLTLEWKE
jgi:hypothetical protein